MRLVELTDELLDYLEDEPDFRCFNEVLRRANEECEGWTFHHASHDLEDIRVPTYRRLQDAMKECCRKAAQPAVICVTGKVADAVRFLIGGIPWNAVPS